MINTETIQICVEIQKNFLSYIFSNNNKGKHKCMMLITYLLNRVSKQM